MPRPTTSFTHLAGVPVHYDRLPAPHHYGTRGQARTFYCEQRFINALEDAFRELWDVCPHGQAQVITSAGAYVDKGGQHGAGRAFDLDGIFWRDRTFITNEYPDDSRFYVAAEAVLRKHFGVILNYEWNRAHHDHFHLDQSISVGYRTNKNTTLFVQMALRHVLGQPTVTIDGNSGSGTRGGLRAVLPALGLARVHEIDTSAKLAQKMQDIWLEFCDRVAARGFQQPAASQPADARPPAPAPGAPDADDRENLRTAPTPLETGQPTPALAMSRQLTYRIDGVWQVLAGVRRSRLPEE